MRRAIVAFVAICLLLPLPLLAVDAGRAEGRLTVNGTEIPLAYAYAVGGQNNDLSHRNDDTRIILTDKPLPDGTDLSKVDYAFPEGILGVVVCINPNHQVTHVIVQHAAGTYDAGYFENVPEYRFRTRTSDPGMLAGNVSSKRVSTATVTFSYEAEFNAVLK
jgi:hypothetical protein